MYSLPRYFDNSTERVVDALLEGNLPPPLLELDQKFEIEKKVQNTAPQPPPGPPKPPPEPAATKADPELKKKVRFIWKGKSEISISEIRMNEIY